MKLVIEHSVVVVTPTTGSHKLRDAIKSVQNQTYNKSCIEHLIVSDGPSFHQDTETLVDDCHEPNSVRSRTLLLPYNTGRDGFYGHRIYAGVSHLVNADYVFFLDEDNWYEPDHISSMVEVLNRGVDVAFSLRKIYDQNKDFVAEDNCEALGPDFPIFFTHGPNPGYLIDTSAYAFKRSFLEQTGHLWHSGWGGDRRYLASIMGIQGLKIDSNYKHTLCYRLDGNPNSVTREFFEQGNRIQLENYNGEYPWKK